MTSQSRKNKLTQNERNFPVDFVYPRTEEFDIIINIPEGFKVSELPEAYSLKTELVEIDAKYTKTGDVIKINAIYSFKKGLYYASEYLKIKSYMDTIVKRFNSEIVFEKV